MLDKILDLLCRITLLTLCCIFGYSLVRQLAYLVNLNNEYLLYPLIAVLALVFYKLLIMVYEWAKGAD